MLKIMKKTATLKLTRKKLWKNVERVGLDTEKKSMIKDMRRLLSDDF